jgi:hypothetical protein
MGTGSSAPAARARVTAPHRIAWLGLVLAAAIAACAKDEPTAPGGYSISGRVRLIGFLVNADGSFAGTRVVDDASGVAVELIYGTTVVQRTTTVGGVYRFGGLAPGAYQARARVVDAVADQTPVLTIAGASVMAGDTLLLKASGDLTPVPNPSADTVVVYFGVPAAEYAELRVRELGGSTTRLLVSQVLPPTFLRVVWNGRDGAGHPAAPGLYWMTYEAGADTRAQLLFR